MTSIVEILNLRGTQYLRLAQPMPGNPAS